MLTWRCNRKCVFLPRYLGCNRNFFLDINNMCYWMISVCVNETETVCFDCNVNGQCLDCSRQWELQQTLQQTDSIREEAGHVARYADSGRPKKVWNLRGTFECHCCFVFELTMCSWNQVGHLCFVSFAVSFGGFVWASRLQTYLCSGSVEDMAKPCLYAKTLLTILVEQRLPPQDALITLFQQCAHYIAAPWWCQVETQFWLYCAWAE